MSIASEIARLQQAKADLKTAINNKGGNITTERIDQFASAVASLPSPKEEEERILTPDFSSGNHVIVPTTGKVLRRVTLTKPAQFIPENIKKGVDLCGVVGTAETGESGGYEVYVRNGGGGNHIELVVEFSWGGEAIIEINGTHDLHLKNVVWLRVLNYYFDWTSSTGITKEQATSSGGHTLTEDVYIRLDD